MASFITDTFHNGFQAFSKSPRIAYLPVEYLNQFVDTAVEESFGDLACFNAAASPVSEERFCQRPVAYMQRIVFLFATEHLNGSFQFSFPSDEWIVVLQTVIQTSYKSFA